ncbi:hypothetical protein [Sorangium sp. So ce131]|uniref:hypothetical protein n=1 Tax=Sorangium sp. So ce131 TaxID=3133282 RepID=UPI003F5E3D0B
MPQEAPRSIDLHTPLTLRSSFRFPLQSQLARREVLWGALLLFLPGVGWLLNMGHRIEMVHRMQRGLPAWPAWGNYPRLLKHGVITALGMVFYGLPAIVAGAAAWATGRAALAALAAALFVAAVVAIPGYMSHYCRRFDPREIFHPGRALGRVFQGGARYWKAWGIALAGLALSFTGLLALGVGFLVTSVWFWQVAGFSFATVFTRRFDLDEARGAGELPARPTASTSTSPGAAAAGSVPPSA